MCIRDSSVAANTIDLKALNDQFDFAFEALDVSEINNDLEICLLYTSDAADERSSVDLGGRRIIKKKNTPHTHIVTDLEIWPSNRREWKVQALTE